MQRLIRLVLVPLNLLLALLLMGATLSGVIRPSSNIIVALLGYTYVPLLVANVLMMLVWMAMSSKWFLLSAAVIVVRWSYVPLFFQMGGSEREAQQSSVSALSFNVHHFYGRSFAADITDLSTIDSNVVAFLSLIDSRKPDLLMLQEFVPTIRGLRVADSLAQRGYTHWASASVGKTPNGVVLFSRLPICTVQRVDSLTMLQADVVQGSDTLRLFCVHFNSYHLDEGDYQEMGRVAHGTVDRDSVRGTLSKIVSTSRRHEQEIDRLMPLVQQSPYPVLLAGDFNDTPASYAYHQATRLLVDAYRECGHGFSTTYHGPFPAFRIDYILHSPSLRTLSYSRVRNDISDHYPLYATVELPSR